MTVSPMHAGDGSLDPKINAAVKATIKLSYQRPDDAAYTAILRGTVRNCVDVIVIDQDTYEVLMGWRVNEPWKDHWHPSGGGQVPGDSYGETGAAHLKRDLGLNVSPESLQFVNSASFPWSTSAQGVPCHMNGVLVAGMFPRKFLDTRTTPDKGDFARSKFFQIKEVTMENGFHPAIAIGITMIRFNIRLYGRVGTHPPDLLKVPAVA